jgi:5-methylcytosine-specific restriction endonuclease McrA
MSILKCPERLAALAAGERHFFTGQPCRKGHVAKRFTSIGQCVECGKACQAKYYAANPDKYRERRRRAYRSDPEQARAIKNKSYRKNQAVILERSSRDYWENPEKYRERRRQYGARNPEKCRDGLARWQKANRERVIALNHAYRAAKRSAEGRFTADDLEHIKKQQGGKCAACRRRRKLTVDHIVPLTRGGSNWPNNLQLLCRSCNSAKNNKDPIAFMQARGRLL